MTYLMEMTDARPDRAIAAAVAATMELAKQEFKTEIFEGDYPVSGIGLTNLAQVQSICSVCGGPFPVDDVVRRARGEYPQEILVA